MNKKDREVHQAIEGRFKKAFNKLGQKWRHLLYDERFSSLSFSAYLDEAKEADNSDTTPDDQVIGEGDLSDDQMLRLLAIKKARLTAQQRMIVYLCGEKGMSMEQAASVLRIKKGSLQTQLETAREKIQEKYESLRNLPYEEGI